MLSGKVMIICLIIELIRKMKLDIIIPNEFIQNQISLLRNKVKIQLDLSNYAKESNIRRATATGIDKSAFGKKVD